MEMGKLNQAADRFMAADERGDSPIINNNLGAVARMKGNLHDAKRLLTAPSGAGDAVKYNKGILAIQEGNYSQAVSNFSGENTANAALAKIAERRCQRRQDHLEQLPRRRVAVAHYFWPLPMPASATAQKPRSTATWPSKRTLAFSKASATLSSATRLSCNAPHSKKPRLQCNRGFFLGHIHPSETPFDTLEGEAHARNACQQTIPAATETLRLCLTPN